MNGETTIAGSGGLVARELVPAKGLGPQAKARFSHIHTDRTKVLANTEGSSRRI